MEIERIGRREGDRGPARPVADRSSRRVVDLLLLIPLLLLLGGPPPRATAGVCGLKRPAPGVDPLEGLFGDPLGDLPVVASSPRDPALPPAADLRSIGGVMDPEFVAVRLETYGQPSFAYRYWFWLSDGKGNLIVIEAQPGVNGVLANEKDLPGTHAKARTRSQGNHLDVYLRRADFPKWVKDSSQLIAGDSRSMPALDRKTFLDRSPGYVGLMSCGVSP